jgi:hypothetical protein
MKMNFVAVAEMKLLKRQDLVEEVKEVLEVQE